MRESSTLIESSRRIAPLSESSEEAARLASRIQAAVQEETGHAIRGLLVEVNQEGVRLSGFCDSYYSKQLAQHAAMSVPGGHQLCNCIEVS